MYSSPRLAHTLLQNHANIEDQQIDNSNSDNDSNFDSAEEDLENEQSINNDQPSVESGHQHNEDEPSQPIQPERRYPVRKRAVPSTFQYEEIVNKKSK